MEADFFNNPMIGLGKQNPQMGLTWLIICFFLLLYIKDALYFSLTSHRIREKNKKKTNLVQIHVIRIRSRWLIYHNLWHAFKGHWMWIFLSGYISRILASNYASQVNVDYLCFRVCCFHCYALQLKGDAAIAFISPLPSFFMQLHTSSLFHLIQKTYLIFESTQGFMIWDGANNCNMSK